MVRFGFPKHQKVYQGHKMVPCEFRIRPYLAPDLLQLPHGAPNEKWQPFAPHQPLKKTKHVFRFFSYKREPHQANFRGRGKLMLKTYDPSK